MKIEERAQNRATLQSLGYSVEDILAMDDATFESFKTNYLGVLGSLYENDELMLGSINIEAGFPVGDYLEATQGLIDALDSLDLSSINAGINSSYLGVLSLNDGMLATAEILKTIAETTATSLELVQKVTGNTSGGSAGGGGVLSDVITTEKETGTHSKTTSGSLSAFSSIKKDLEDAVEVVKGFRAEMDIASKTMIDPFQTLTDSVRKMRVATGEEFEKYQALAESSLPKIFSMWGTMSENEKALVIQNLSEMVSQYDYSIDQIYAAAGEFLKNYEIDEIVGGIVDNMQYTAEQYQDTLALYAEGTIYLTEQEVDIITQRLDELNKDIAKTKQELENLQNRRPTSPIGMNSSGMLGGTAHLGGTAFVGGKWQAGKDSTALVGEEGVEIVAHRSGTFDIVGKNGAEFANIKHDDVVFDAKQSAALLKNGRINSRGKAYVGGKDNYSPLSSIDPNKFAMLNAFTSFSNMITPQIMNIGDNIEALTKRFASPISSTNTAQNITLSIGDINVTGVQDVNGLSSAIVKHLPNQLLQEIHKR